jgi:hypothetical protein
MSEKAAYFNSLRIRHSERLSRPLEATAVFAKESGAGPAAGLAGKGT